MHQIKVTTLFCLLTLALIPVAHADTPLETSMKKIATAFKQLNLDLAQPVEASKADYVALATTIKTESQTSRDLVPKKAAALPADQQAAMVAAYQKSIDDFSAAVDVLIQQLQDGKWDDAKKQLAILKQDETDGHKQFRIKKN